MNIHLTNYSLSRSETVFAAVTLTGGALVNRHWCRSREDMPVCSQWSHRIIALIEAVPLLGGLVAIIEIVAVRFLSKDSTLSIPADSHPSIATDVHSPLLEFNIPTTLTCVQTLALKILTTTGESALPEYVGSIFHCVRQDGAGYVVTRRKKDGALPLNGKMVQLAPLVGPKDTQSTEGLKVRTLCLDLLSNIEDLQKEKQCRAEEVIGIVRCFLERGALQKKAGFSDFLNVMNVIGEEVKEFLPILKRYSDLVELQEKLPQKVDGRVSRWDKIRTMVCTGLFTRTVVETAELARKIGLHPIPSLPQQQRIVNAYPTLDAINLLESHHREAGRWIMQHTRVITFRELCRSIKASCEQICDSILKWDDYYLLSIEGKSQEWMADIAYRYLPPEKMPKGVLPLCHYSAGNDLFEHLTKSGSNNFILFDDGAYSARQFSNYLGDLYSSLVEKGSLKEKKNIYFIFGLFPDDIYVEMDFRHFEKFNVNIQILCNLLTKNFDTLMESEKLDPSLTTQIKDLICTERPQLATEWKRPDFMSTSIFITQGYLGNYSKARYGELHMVDDSVEQLHGVGPITNVIPPYRKKTS
jgi:hypothetical protein